MKATFRTNMGRLEPTGMFVRTYQLTRPFNRYIISSMILLHKDVPYTWTRPNFRNLRTSTSMVCQWSIEDTSTKQLIPQNKPEKCVFTPQVRTIPRFSSVRQVHGPIQNQQSAEWPIPTKKKNYNDSLDFATCIEVSQILSHSQNLLHPYRDIPWKWCWTQIAFESWSPITSEPVLALIRPNGHYSLNRRFGYSIGAILSPKQDDNGILRLSFQSLWNTN